MGHSKGNSPTDLQEKMKEKPLITRPKANDTSETKAKEQNEKAPAVMFQFDNLRSKPVKLPSDNKVKPASKASKVSSCKTVKDVEIILENKMGLSFFTGDDVYDDEPAAATPPPPPPPPPPHVVCCLPNFYGLHCSSTL